MTCVLDSINVIRIVRVVMTGERKKKTQKKDDGKTQLREFNAAALEDSWVKTQNGAN